MKQNTAKTMGLLKQALTAAGNDPSLTETRNHIRQAMTRLENVEKKHQRVEKQTEYQKWWGHVVSGTTAMSPQAASRSLRELNTMISSEQKKILDLEQQSQTQKSNPGLLQD